MDDARDHGRRRGRRRRRPDSLVDASGWRAALLCGCVVTAGGGLFTLSRRATLAAATAQPHAASLRARAGAIVAQRMGETLEIVVLDGDQTGQELLEQALRVLDPDVLGFEFELRRFDLSLQHRRETSNAVVHEAAAATNEAGFALKAATITPEGARRRRLAEPDPARGGRRQGDHPHRPAHPGCEPGRRRAPPDQRRADGGRGRLRRRAVARGRARRRPTRSRFAPRRSTRSTCRAVAEYAFRTARATWAARVYGGPKWTVSPVYEGMLKEEMDDAAARYPDVAYEPVLIDATYAGLISGAADAPLVIPALNRDGDCLSDLVMPMFGSIAGAESVLLAFDDELDDARGDGRGAARHRAGARGQGHRQPDGDDPRLRRACCTTPHVRRPRAARIGVARRSTRACSRRWRAACARPTSRARRRRPSSRPT